VLISKKDVLAAFAENMIGGAEEHCGATEECWPIIEQLKSEGLIEQVWVLSKAGRAVAGVTESE